MTTILIIIYIMGALLTILLHSIATKCIFFLSDFYKEDWMIILWVVWPVIFFIFLPYYLINKLGENIGEKINEFHNKKQEEEYENMKKFVEENKSILNKET